MFFVKLVCEFFLDAHVQIATQIFTNGKSVNYSTCTASTQIFEAHKFGGLKQFYS